ncbi:MAG: hypothetical protein H8E21_14260 [Gammaproteobacteria bacterium]|nr:hypothetical protein [Gammaproteobacteria bacterium]
MQQSQSTSIRSSDRQYPRSQAATQRWHVEQFLKTSAQYLGLEYSGAQKNITLNS